LNSKTIISLLLVIAFPFAGYFLVKHYSKDVVVMPKHYAPELDSVNGGVKTITTKKGVDTVWHRIKNIQFTNQLGKKVSLDDLHGKIIVMDFFFTSCPSICPGLARNMKKLQESFKDNPEIVQFISVSVDPERDSVPKLRAFADRLNINHDSWWFVTGNRKEIYDFAIKELRANVFDPNIDTAFIHTEKFFLIDSNRTLRGKYHGFNKEELAQLAKDIPTLMLERDKKSPSIFREYIPILWVIFTAIGITLLTVFLLFRNKKKEDVLDKFKKE
jgi:protein SCO1/2